MFKIKAEIGFRLNPDLITALKKLSEDAYGLTKQQRKAFGRYLDTLNCQHDAIFELKNMTGKEMAFFIKD